MLAHCIQIQRKRRRGDRSKSRKEVNFGERVMASSKNIILVIVLGGVRKVKLYDVDASSNCSTSCLTLRIASSYNLIYSWYEDSHLRNAVEIKLLKLFVTELSRVEWLASIVSTSHNGKEPEIRSWLEFCSFLEVLVKAILNILRQVNTSRPIRITYLSLVLFIPKKQVLWLMDRDRRPTTYKNFIIGIIQ